MLIKEKRPEPADQDDVTRPACRTLRILDIGSGVGLFTSRLLARLAAAGVLGERKLEVSLLDIFPTDPTRHFQGSSLLSRLSKLEYISQDYAQWIGQVSREKAEKFDIVLICRMLHNLSEFRVERITTDRTGTEGASGRYPLYPHMSDYYYLIAALMGRDEDPPAPLSHESNTFCPCRVLDPAALLTPDGRSIIESLLRIAGGILIEDGDLTADILLDHMRRYVRADSRVYDLSHTLRLSVNHVYWITTPRGAQRPRTELIWPQ